MCYGDFGPFCVLQMRSFGQQLDVLDEHWMHVSTGGLRALTADPLVKREDQVLSLSFVVPWAGGLLSLW